MLHSPFLLVAFTLSQRRVKARPVVPKLGKIEQPTEVRPESSGVRTREIGHREIMDTTDDR